MESHNFKEGPGAALKVLLCSPGASLEGTRRLRPPGRSTALEAAPRAKTSTVPPKLMQLMLRGLAGTSIEEVCFRRTAGVR